MIKYDNVFIKVDNDTYLRLSLDEYGIARKFIIIDTPEAKRFAGFMMMSRDIDLVIEAINQLEDPKQPIIVQQSLLFFVIIAYSKCFTINNGNRPSLNFTDIFKDTHNHFVNEHNKIMNMRNGYVAHAGSGFDKCIITGTIVESRGTIIGIDVNSQFTYAVNIPTKLSDFKDLCLFLKDKIKIKSDKVWNKITDHTSNLTGSDLVKIMIKPNISELYRMAETGEPSPDGSKHYDFIKLEI